MTLFEAAIYGPFYAVVASGIFYALSPIAEVVDRPWAGKVVVALALVLATLAVWFVGNMPQMGGGPELPPGYELPDDWRDWKGYGLPPSKN